MREADSPFPTLEAGRQGRLASVVVAADRGVLVWGRFKRSSIRRSGWTRYGIGTGLVICFCTLRDSRPGSSHEQQQDLPALHRAPKLIPT